MMSLSPPVTAVQFDFAFDLAREIAKDHVSFLFSPAAVTYPLTILYTGSKGRTESELRHVLGGTAQPIDIFRQCWPIEKSLNGYSDPRATIRHYSKILLPSHVELLDSLRTFINERCPGSLDRLDFNDVINNVQKINQFVLEETKGNMNLFLTLDAFDNVDKMLIINALYFKGAWIRRFPKTDTKPELFYINPVNHYQVEMMNVTDGFNYYENDIMQCLHMDYVPGHTISYYSMYFILPRDRHNVRGVIEQLSGSELLDIISYRMKFERLQVKVPKFRLQCKLDMHEYLSRIGLKKCFSSEEANFSGISGKRDIHLQKMIHKVCLELDESGCTTEHCHTPPNPSYDYEFTCDQPFIVVIVWTKTVVSFVGVVTNP